MATGYSQIVGYGCVMWLLIARCKTKVFKIITNVFVSFYHPFKVILTDEEKERMIKLPKKQYLLDQGAEATVMLGLVDIMFAYCYDMRISDGDHSVSL